MTISDEKLAEIKTAAWNCDRWPEWLFDLAEVVSTWALDSDASQEQASGLAALLAIEMQASRATPAGVTEDMVEQLRIWVCDEVLPSYDIDGEIGRIDPDLWEACHAALTSALCLPNPAPRGSQPDLSATGDVERLRDEIERSRNTWSDWYAQANDQRNKAEARADALQAKLDEAKAVLEPFADAVHMLDEIHSDDYAPDWSPFIVAGAYRRARTFLATLTEHIDGDVLNSAGKSNVSDGWSDGGLRGERQASTSGGGNG